MDEPGERLRRHIGVNFEVHERNVNNFVNDRVDLVASSQHDGTGAQGALL
jgi:hypothetical protein